MKRNEWLTKAPGTLVFAGVASLCMAFSALGQLTVTQPDGITIPDFPNRPTPYPQTYAVSNLVGEITKVTVSLNNLTHPYASDVAVLLRYLTNNTVAGSVVLMSDAGGASALGGTVAFEDGKDTLPQFSQIGSGPYKPANYAGLVSFPPNVPGPTGTTLGAFNGAAPNGTWQLYVYDDAALPTAAASLGSWTVKVWTRPSIATTNNSLTILENGEGTFHFTVNSSTVNPDNLTVTATSDNSNLVASLTPGGAGQNRTLTVKPKDFQNTTTAGAANVTIKVTDGVSDATATFALTVTPVNQAPTIAITNATINTIAGVVSAPINAVVDDIDNPASALRVVVTSSANNIVAPSGVLFNNTDQKLRTFTVVPVGTATGTAVLTFAVDDGQLTNSTTTVTVNVGVNDHPIFANTTPLGLSAEGLTNTAIAVTNISGRIGKLTVSLNSPRGIAADNLSATLVGPGAQAITLIDSESGATGLNFSQLTFDDAATGTSLPSASSIAQVKLDAPLEQLVGASANGTWNLYVTNGGAGGLIAGGWLLDIYAAPVINTSITNLAMNAGTTATATIAITSMNSTITNKSDITFQSGNSGLVAASVDTYDTATGQGVIKFVSPGPAFGSTTVTMSVKDNRNFVTTFTYNVTVNFVNRAPVIGFVDKVITRAGTATTNVVFSVSDPDDAVLQTPQTVTVVGYSDQQKVIPDANIVITPGAAPNTRNLVMFPIGTNTGTVNIRLVANDGTASTTNTFQLFVLEPGNPLFWNQGLITVVANDKANPYPGNVNVSGLVGKIANVEVTLYNINVANPEDLQVQVVSPGIRKPVLLMSGAGGANNLAATTLVFSQAAAGGLPNSDPIISGTYQPTQHGSAVAFPSDSPGIGLPDLTGFNGQGDTNLNGNWGLYVYSKSSLTRGTILDGWQLSIKTAPYVAPIANQRIRESDGTGNNTTSVQITVGDNQPGVVIDVGSTVSPEGIIDVAFEGTGGTRTMKITPRPFQVGSNIVVTVTATSGSLPPSSTQFNVDVFNADLPPVFVTQVPGLTNSAAQMSSGTFKVWDPQGSPITFEKLSSEPRVIPVENITITQVGPSDNGTNTYRIDVLPADTQTGVSQVTVRARNGLNLTRSSSAFIQVNQALVVMNQDGAITIPEGKPVLGPASPYPSVANVSGLNGFVTGVEVTLLGLSHGYPEDISVLLVSPDSKKGVILMARAGGSTPAGNLRVSFKDGATTPALGEALVNNSAYSPVSYASGLNFNVPGLATSAYTTNLASFTGTGPNGDWKLYVMDEAFPIGGSIAGWILTLQTSPAFVNLADVTTLQNIPVAVPVSVVDQSSGVGGLTVYATPGQSSPTNLPNFNLVTQDNLTVTNNGGGTWTVTIKPTLHLPSSRTNVNGTIPINLQVADATSTNTGSFLLTVVVSNEPPVIVADKAALGMTENLIGQPAQSQEVTFTFTDVDSTLNVTNTVVTFDNPNLVPDNTNNLVKTFGNGTVTVKLTPVVGEYGTNNLTVALGDGNQTSTKSIPLSVTNIYQAPYFQGLAASYNTPAGQLSAPFTFSVKSTEGVPGRNLEVTATSQSSDIIPNGNILITASGDERSFQVLPLGTVSGPATITFKVVDVAGSKTNTQSVVVNVQPPPAGLYGSAQVVSIVGNPTNQNWTYPVILDVTNIVGPIWSVSMEMRGVSNSSPANLDALLVAPDQTAVSLMSGGGGTDPVNGLNLEFKDGGDEMPLTGPLASGTYNPSYYTKRVLPGNPTTNIYQTRMSAFVNKTDYLGQWKLYLDQAAVGTFARFSGGFFLKIVPAPLITPEYESITMEENTETNLLFTVTDSVVTWGTNLTVTAVSDNPNLLSVGNPSLVNPPTVNYTLLLKPRTYTSGSANVTLTARRADGAQYSKVVRVNVNAKNWPPEFASRLLPVSTPAGQTAQITFLVFDPDTVINSPTNMSIRAWSGNTTVLADSGLVFTASGTNFVNGLPLSASPQTAELVLRMTPNQFAIGSATVNLELVDATADGTNVVLTNFVFNALDQKFPPQVTPPANVTVIAGRDTGNLPFTVITPNLGSPTIQVTASSGNQSLTGDITITPSGAVANQTNWTVKVATKTQPGTFQPTPVTITLTARDTVNNLSSTGTFTVMILPAPVFTFANNRSVNIRDNATADPYPSEIEIGGMLGNIAKVDVTLNGYYHSYPADVNVLLVGPGDKKVVLMNKAGGGSPIRETNALNLTFDMSASGPIPQGLLESKSYKPANYNPAFTFPSAPGPYSVDLATFNNMSPNGVWKLYIVDDGAPDAGALKNGWSLTIETQPVLSLTTNLLVMNMGTTATLGLTIADDAPPGEYKFAATSTNSTLLPANGVKVTGTGAAYTVEVTPKSDEYGTNLVTLWATNILSQVVSTQFGMNVLLVTNPPVINAIANVNTVQATPANTEFVFGDALVEQDKLQITYQSSNPTLVPVGNIRLANAPQTTKGVFTNALVVTPAGDALGQAELTVTVKAPDNRGGLSTTRKFMVTVLRSATPVFANTGAIIINDRAPATPYANTINVSGVQGTVRSVVVDVTGLAHTYPNDVSLLLVGPGNQKVVLMSRAGNGIPITGVNVSFDDNGGTMPSNAAITSSTYKPSNYNPLLNFYSGPPAGSIVTNLSVFNGTNPNGTWTLYVQDDQTPDSGQITGGWRLRLVTTAPTIASIGAQVTSENTALQVPFTVGTPVANISNLVVTAAGSDVVPAGLIPANGLTVAINPTNRTQGTLTITPGLNLPSAVTNVDGSAMITVSVTDGTNSASTSFPLTVLWVNQKPGIAGLTSFSTAANVPVSRNFQLTDPDSPASSLSIVSTTSSNIEIGTVGISGSGIDRTLTFTPNGTLGQTTVTIVTSDTLTFGTNSIVITATNNLPTQISTIADRTVDENQGAALVSVNFTVTYKTDDTVIAGSADNSAVVSGVSVRGLGNNYNAAITLVPYGNGETIITLVASNQFGLSERKFKLTVNPIDYPPTLGPIAPVTAVAHSSVIVPLTVVDPDTALNALTYKLTSDKPSLISASAFTVNEGVVSLTMVLAECEIGTASLTVTVEDTTTLVSQKANLTVTAPVAPSISAIADVTVTNEETLAISVPFTVTAGGKPMEQLTITAQNSNTSLVSAVDILPEETGMVASLTLVEGATGVATITINVSDCITTVTKSFKVSKSSGVIVNVTAQNSAAGRPAAEWTGRTFDVYNVTPATTYTVPLFAEDVLALTDRLHQWNGSATNLPLPGYLVGQEYILTAQENRGTTNFSMTVTVARDATIYLLVDYRVGDNNNANPPSVGANGAAMKWLDPANGWVPASTGHNRANSRLVPDEVAMDEAGDGVGPGVALNQWAAVYAKYVTEAGDITIPAQGFGGINMYGVVVVPGEGAGLVQPVKATVALDDGNLVISWTGGVGPYYVDRADALAGAETVWTQVAGPLDETSVSVPATGNLGFYRIRSAE